MISQSAVPLLQQIEIEIYFQQFGMKENKHQQQKEETKTVLA